MTFENNRMMTFVVVVVVLVVLSLLSAEAVSDCHRVRYAVRDFNIKDIPRRPRQGAHLQICPRGMTCCTEEMEQKLRSVAQKQYTEAISASAQSIRTLFSSRANKFDSFFMELLSESKLKFHKLFQRLYGIIYERNSDVFIDFFKDLEAYYDKGEVNIEEALKRFFSQLYQRMFVVFNAQHDFDQTYLSCVSMTMKKLQPFGDVPKKLTEQLRRSFVATRTFVQGLLEGKKVLSKILKIHPKEKCVEALTKMSSCPACQGYRDIRPCSDYCFNVMKGCLAYHAELGDSWDKFVETLQVVSDRLVGPFDIEGVVVPIGVKISDAIMNFQNSGYEVSGKVFEECGKPRLQKRQSSSYYSESSSSGKRNDFMNDQDDSRLKNLIKEIKEDVVKTKGFWTRLPYDLCENHRKGDDTNDDEDEPGNEKNGSPCWNGESAGPYVNKVVPDGLAYQDANPEVDVDITKPDININEQIFALKLITKKLEKAANGSPVSWDMSTYSVDHDEGSSGDCENIDDEDCYRSSDEDYDYYGSGSGDGEDSYAGSHSYDDDDSEDVDEDESWPPWVTPKSPVDSSPNSDITINNDNVKTTTKTSTSDTKKTSSSSSSSSSSTIVRGLIYYLVPLFTCFLGSAVSSW